MSLGKFYAIASQKHTPTPLKVLLVKKELFCYVHLVLATSNLSQKILNAKIPTVKKLVFSSFLNHTAFKNLFLFQHRFPGQRMPYCHNIAPEVC